MVYGDQPVAKGMADLKFNLKSLQHSFANSMNALLLATPVKDLKDVNQTVLNTSNKDIIVNSALNATKLLKASHGLLISYGQLI